ncbi:unnamed protein product [Periconia digitata]|uniref:Uncharacterized protein n=1 Tax=Periconia digitata TaxID=1303443 RepID=A0A9W4XKT8_9PLEO|nr:unnamed protein product [Periconia digitata]
MHQERESLASPTRAIHELSEDPFCALLFRCENEKSDADAYRGDD